MNSNEFSRTIYSAFIVLLTLIAAAVISGVLGTLFWFIVYLLNVDNYAHRALKMLAGFLFLLILSTEKGMITHLLSLRLPVEKHTR